MGASLSPDGGEQEGRVGASVHRSIGVTYKTAWFLWHPIREAMPETDPEWLGAERQTFEADETYGGEKPRKEAGASKVKRWRGTKKPVAVFVERKRRVRARKIVRVDGPTLKAAIRENVNRPSRIVTDEWLASQSIGAEFACRHEVVTHSAGEYARGDAQANTAESYFALLKHGIIGSFHHVSKKNSDR